MYANELAVGSRAVTVAAGATATADVQNTGPLYPALWSIGTWEGTPNETQVGNPSLPGSAVFVPAGGTWTVAGSGADIAGTADHFHFVAQGFPGDGSDGVIAFRDHPCQALMHANLHIHGGRRGS